jgi:hypothetical protein
MPQLVFEFWSQEIKPLVEAITLVLEGCQTENESATLSLQYEPTQQGLDWAAQQLSTGQISSFVLHPRNGCIRYAMLNGPGISDDKQPGYMGTIEYTEADYLPIWNRLLEVDGLRIVCLGHEEGVEFSGDQISAETFPWDDFFLVIGAVRSNEGNWTLKHGPNYFPSVSG